MRTKNDELLKKIQSYVESYCDKHGYSPTVREVANEVGVGASGAYRYMSALVADGRLVKTREGYMSKEFANTEKSMRSVAILGAVPCGPLTEVEEYIEGYLRLPASFVGNGKIYLLTANGDSMIGAGISDGDYVLIRQQETAEVGDIVVALVENEVTLKRLQYNSEQERYYLHPENPKYDDIYVPQLMVQGVAIKVVKDLK